MKIKIKLIKSGDQLMSELILTEFLEGLLESELRQLLELNERLENYEACGIIIKVLKQVKA